MSEYTNFKTWIDNWMKSKGKLGGQNKVPRLSNNRDTLEELLKLNQ